MTLSLPIVVGKKYVRRDGVVTTTSAPGKYYENMSGGPFVCVAQPSENRESGKYNAFAVNGRILAGPDDEHEQDLVADYIEPAKGHPHAALMAEFAKDAAASTTPWDRWEIRDGNGWTQMRSPPSWVEFMQYRRRPTITPDPHAQSAAEYAKDMAETDKAWERWEWQEQGDSMWQNLDRHPSWNKRLNFRRKEAL